MRILFSATHFGFLRNFQSTIRVLAEHGHDLYLVAERGDAIDGQKMADILAAEYPSIIFDRIGPTRHRLYQAFGAGLRATLDYWRYLDPRWDHSPKLRRRAEQQAPALARAVARWPLLGSPAGLASLQRLVRTVERALPPPSEVRAVFERAQPDLLFLTPLLYFGSRQVDQVRCAQQLGIPTMLGVGSWDHLTTKGLIHEIPDRVLVWNHAQKREAVELHGVPEDRVVVTGSQAYDHWFATQPALGREAFCRQVGLDADRPILLYLCSSPFIAPHEVGFVRKWIAAIRASDDDRVRAVSVLVRPHPQNAGQWADIDLANEFAHAALWPKGGVNPIGGVARSDYFDSMYHAEAVVGINTSGMIESGIIGRPVYSIVSDEFAATQEGTLHFQHLKNVEGGLLHLARGFEAHTVQLARLLADGGDERRRARLFIQAFVRPHGLEEAATPRVVADIERLASEPKPRPRHTSLSALVIRVAFAPAALAAMVITLDPPKMRSVLLRWTRPVRMIARGLVSRAIYTGRFALRLPRRLWRLVLLVVRRLIVSPMRWTYHQGKMRLHAFLVARKGEPDQVP